MMKRDNAQTRNAAVEIPLSAKEAAELDAWIAEQNNKVTRVGMPSSSWCTGQSRLIVPGKMQSARRFRTRDFVPTNSRLTTTADLPFVAAHCLSTQ